MASRHLTIRMDPESLDRLDRESRRQRRSRSEVARALLEEGLRMEAHPGIVFRDGPAGRRAGLMAGPDVWEVMSGFPGGDLDEAVQYAAEFLNLPVWKIRTAHDYYLAFRDEIDEWIRRNQELAERGQSGHLEAHKSE